MRDVLLGSGGKAGLATEASRTKVGLLRRLDTDEDDHEMAVCRELGVASRLAVCGRLRNMFLALSEAYECCGRRRAVLHPAVVDDDTDEEGECGFIFLA